jgi:hypothetical protein
MSLTTEILLHSIRLFANNPLRHRDLTYRLVRRHSKSLSFYLRDSELANGPFDSKEELKHYFILDTSNEYMVCLLVDLADL